MNCLVCETNDRLVGDLCCASCKAEIPYRQWHLWNEYDVDSVGLACGVECNGQRYFIIPIPDHIKEEMFCVMQESLRDTIRHFGAWRPAFNSAVFAPPP